MLWVLAEAILMNTHNIPFYGELTKIILQSSLNTLLICSTVIFNHVDALSQVKGSLNFEF